MLYWLVCNNLEIQEHPLKKQNKKTSGCLQNAQIPEKVQTVIQSTVQSSRSSASKHANCVRIV